MNDDDSVEPEPQEEQSKSNAHEKVIREEGNSLSGLHPALSMPYVYGGLGAELAEWAADLYRPEIDLSRFVFDIAPVGLAVADMVHKQMAEMAGFRDFVRTAMEPLALHFRQQWIEAFESFAEIRKRIYPENLHAATPSIEVFEKLLIDEGIPLMWVPGPKVVEALIGAPDAAARRRIIGRRWKGIVSDCEAVLTSIDHPGLAEPCEFARSCVDALRDGHANPAQALAANLLDTLMRNHFDSASRVKLTKNEFKKKGVKFNLDDYSIRVAFTFAPVWYAHTEYWPKNGDPIPGSFGRHPSAHGVSRVQYKRVNAVMALMLVTSVLKFCDLELER
ncbi:hypothetical protein [Streptomyces lonarensis]|uniref:Uncharacterized protein n=1 Tax=Streptomyces lonarensis TaxID=700599 RepID=A0A7X6CZP3_9ACTN|nr:hypothetical protein [Streptomyces lonarensis]NJQ05508.1 hypothetical protein [Streptomyces lonarensis]